MAKSGNILILVLILLGSIAPGLAQISSSSRTISHKQQVHSKKKHKHKDYMNGIASYYAKSLSGRRTASGQHLCMDTYTAAHPTLALKTKLKVTNLRNGRIIYVEVNDRMPRSSGRVIDLTEAGAKALGFYHHGLTRVHLTIVSNRDYQAHRKSK